MVASAPPTGSGRRSAARLAAVQALYQVELGGLSAAAVIEEFRSYRLGRETEGVSYGEADATLFADIVSGRQEHAAEIDRLITARLDKDRQLERLEAILRALLRAGTYELLARPDVPARVIISEYLDVAHAFFAGNEPGFANGVLDRLAHDLRSGEFEGTGHDRSRQPR
jgi:N utilization substance protein B